MFKVNSGSSVPVAEIQPPSKIVYYSGGKPWVWWNACPSTGGDGGYSAYAGDVLGHGEYIKQMMKYLNRLNDLPGQELTKHAAWLEAHTGFLTGETSCVTSDHTSRRMHIRRTQPHPLLTELAKVQKKCNELSRVQENRPGSK